MAKALDLGHRGGLLSQVVTTLQEGVKELASAAESIGLQDLAAAQNASILIGETAMTIEEDSQITFCELHGLDQALQQIRGEHENNLA